MEETVSGFKVSGTWDEVVEHGERITRGLGEVGVEDGALDEWEEWRPKEHEQLEAEVSEKTAELASIGEGEGEAAEVTPEEDIETAREKATELVEALEADGTEDAIEKGEESIEHAVRAADTATRKLLRTVEQTIYSDVMTRFTPYYFDNQLVSATLRPTSRLEDGDEFVFEVNLNDDDLRDALGRWFETSEHVDQSSGDEQP